MTDLWYLIMGWLVDKIVLVTSAMHMPRAAKTFRMHGMEPVPAPGNHFVKSEFDELLYSFEPSLRKIQIMKKSCS